jgi:YYY domain-containing protein
MSTDQLSPSPTVEPPAARRTLTAWPIWLLLIAALAFGAYFRFSGINWSDGQPLHPDENFLTMVTSAIRPPANLGEYFDSQNSPLNPYNNNFDLFVYGDLPIFITRYTADVLDGVCHAAPDLCLHSNGAIMPFASYNGIQLLGRGLSALLDVFALILMFLMGRRLYGARVGALAALLGAATTLQIQQSHFYTADIFAMFFVVAAFYFILRFADTNSWFDVVASGAATGLAIASRINVAPLLGIIAIGAGATVLRQSRTATADARRVTWESAILRVMVAVLAAAIVFRIFMPYAFDGLLKFDPRWSNNMTYIRNLIGGEDPGGPPGVQWTDRAPIVFPWINIVFWGMGVPLGLAAWLSWAWAGWQTFLAPYLKRRRGRLGDWLIDVAQSRHLLIWVWVTAYFVWQGSQWVKSIRYQLPIYPFLTLMTAAALMALWDWARKSAARSAFKRTGAMVAIGVVVVGAYAWAFAFTAIYRQPTTRVSSSQWIYDHVPTALTLTIDRGGETSAVQLPFPNTINYGSDQFPTFAPFTVDQDGTAVSITINRLIDPVADPEPEAVRVAIADTPDGQNPLTQAEVTVHAEQWGAHGGAVTLELPPAALRAGQTYFAVTQAVSGAPLVAESSTIATEAWDEGIPVRLGGRDGYSIYHGVEIQRQWEDTPDKLENLIQWLDQSDYVTLSSNRAYGSMSRQPLRYPLTIEYYRLLFTGQLGFKLVAAFESYPTLGPFTFPDQETTQLMNLWPDPTRCPQSGVPQCHGLINVPMPPAEEAFSVYDHPRVLIFQKQPDFSVADVRAKLSRVSLRDVLRDMTPMATTAAPNGLMLNDQTWAAQQQSGTWADLFDRDGLLNQAPLIGALVWYLVIALLGWLAFPIVWAVAPGLKDRGYGVARIAGLLLVAFAVWFASSYHVVTFSRGSIIAAVLLLAAAAGVLAWRQRSALRAFWAESRTVVLFEEALFAVAFVYFLLVRFGNPDLWHPVMGGEKPMDFAYLNAVLKSDYFPPYDPWYAGGQITYYYFGFVLVATVIKLLGIMPQIAYNFAIPTLFALTVLGTFSAGYNLTRNGQPAGQLKPSGLGLKPLSLKNPIVIGLIAAIFVTFMGNLGEAQLITDEIGKQAAADVDFKSSIPGLELIVKTTVGAARLITEGRSLGFRPEWWYFTPTREIPAPPSEAGPISEFPYFTFLYADLHAHMIALPLTLLLLALAIGWVASPPGWSMAGVGSLVLGGLVAGALRATNTWDFPTYVLIGGAGLVIGTLATKRLKQLATWGDLLLQTILFVGAGLALWTPFTRNYATAYSSIDLWEGSLTPLWAYLNIHLLFLFPIVTLMLWEMRRWGWRWWQLMWRRVLGDWRWLIGLGLALAALASLLAYTSGRVVIVVAAPVLLLCAALMVRKRLDGTQRFWYFIVAVAVGLTFAVEVIVLKGDISRMNTTFKFYIQVWVLLGIAAAVALGWLAERLAAWQGRGKTVWLGFLWLLVGASFLYVPLATRGKINDRFVNDMPPGFDGLAYMTKATYDDTGNPYSLNWDHELITWLQDNVKGTPVIAEGNSPLYHWGNRLAINTGLPAIIGWDWHQRQQRSIMPGQIIDNRLQDVRTFYSSPVVGDALQIIKDYHVKYIVVGGLERSFYPAEGLAKFDQMAADGLLRVAYRNDGAVLYEVVE